MHAGAPRPMGIDVTSRLWHGSDVVMGPGNADLLDAIAANGSIGGAGRAMNMSCRRARQLVDLMNRSFTEPLVHSTTGGHGAGARLTDMGLLVLSRYRAMESALAATAGSHAAGLVALLSASPDTAGTAAEDRPG